MGPVHPDVGARGAGGHPVLAEESPMFDRVGVCSWSLRPASLPDLVEKVAATGVTSVQLALEPFRADPRAWPVPATLKALSERGVSVVSGMMSMKGEDYSTLESIERTGGVRPDDTWRDNLAAAQVDASNADRLGVSLVTFHAGFIPRSKGDAAWTRIRDRILRIADCYAQFDISVALETGQEPPEVLVEFLDDIDNPMIGVNFDPANIILYGNGDPVEAYRAVAPFVDQIHIKDATRSTTPGQWGDEVVVGTGAVDWNALLAAVRDENFIGDAMIEREAGDRRVQDVVIARQFLGGK
jgi:sugar phosphate isomerase/epimerase